MRGKNEFKSDPAKALVRVDFHTDFSGCSKGYLVPKQAKKMIGVLDNTCRSYRDLWQPIPRIPKLIATFLTEGCGSSWAFEEYEAPKLFFDVENIHISEDSRIEAARATIEAAFSAEFEHWESYGGWSQEEIELDPDDPESIEAAWVDVRIELSSQPRTVQELRAACDKFRNAWNKLNVNAVLKENAKEHNKVFGKMRSDALKARKARDKREKAKKAKKAK